MFIAVRKGLEPSTSGVTGRHSNQLNYRTRFSICWSLSVESGCKYRHYSWNCKAFQKKN